MKIHEKILLLSLTAINVSGFTLPSHRSSKFSTIEKNICPKAELKASKKLENYIEHDYPNEFRGNKLMDTNSDRRSLLKKVTQLSLGIVTSSILFDSTTGKIPTAEAAVGTLPEFAETNAILQGLTLNVADISQYEKMLTFLTDSFDFEILRQREGDGVKESWLGFGPEEANIPSDFELPVSSFAMYGGHASLHIRYDTRVPELYYNGKGEAPGNNIAYVQVGVPGYRISQMVKNGGNVLDAYGFVNVVSPIGLPMRAIVGISPDPIMFVGINSEDVQKSREFYEKLGMVEQPYPYARPSNGKGQFEPEQPKGSVYLSHTANNMGILILPSVNPEKRRKKIPVTSNPVIRSLNIIYNPTSSDENEADVGSGALTFNDPSGVEIAFTPYSTFEKQVRIG